MSLHSSPPCHAPRRTAQGGPALWVMVLAIMPAWTWADLPSGPTDLARYQKIWEISPFVAVTDLSGQADDLAGRFVLTGFARMGDKDVVFVFDRTTLERFALTPGDTRNGVSLVNLTHQGDLRSVRATLSSGGRSLEIGYDPTTLPDANPGMASVPGQMGYPPNARTFPGQPQPPRGAGFPGGMPPGQMSSAPSNPNAIIGAQPMTAAPGTPGNPHEAPPPRRVIRRRAIVAPE